MPSSDTEADLTTVSHALTDTVKGPWLDDFNKSLDVDKISMTLLASPSFHSVGQLKGKRMETFSTHSHFFNR